MTALSSSFTSLNHIAGWVAPAGPSQLQFMLHGWREHPMPQAPAAYPCAGPTLCNLDRREFTPAVRICQAFGQKIRIAMIYNENGDIGGSRAVYASPAAPAPTPSGSSPRDPARGARSRRRHGAAVGGSWACGQAEARPSEGSEEARALGGRLRPAVAARPAVRPTRDPFAMYRWIP